ncbi:nucleotide-binding alpha-beta plait domain-containing protein [Artemisia annua]|uniref:Nucleotide-binding alpha-beta plait domain-containing protein n=1 Tax=Artemisia annua TaxID=35608 RepID=A0A2U1NAU1_ARTAN|nr:nucleotide-binding alpha-beta plait domain-containing protein [Artemisia annua]
MGEWQEVPARWNIGRQKKKGEAKGMKRDKEGNRFGFFTFRKVRNALELEKRMNGVKMGPWETIVRKQDKQEDLYGRKQENQEVERQTKINVQPIRPGVGLTFKAALDGKSGVISGGQVISTCKSIKVPDNVVAFFELRGKALIGKVVDLKTLTCMNKILVDNGFGGMDIVYAGGLSLLLNFHEKDDAVDLLLKKEVWSKCFSVLDVWEGQSLPFERVAWLKIQGVPINLATNEVFDDVASQFGKIIYLSQHNLENGDISMGFVGVLVGDGGRLMML